MWTLRILFLLALMYGGYLFYQVYNAYQDSYQPLDREKSDKREQAVTLNDPFTVLLIGTDVRNASDQDWRPDVLMVAAVNPKKHSIKMVSIPRDTYTEIANANGLKTKINSSAYYGKTSGVGGVTNTVQTVENFLNIPIDHYVKINFNGFMDVVDAVDGVDVNVKFPFAVRLFGKMQYYEPGPQQLNGERALGYVRMRKSDPRGDMGRNERQREVLQQIMSKIVSIQSVHRLDDIVRSVGNNVQFSFSFQELTDLQSVYRQTPKKNIENLEVQGKNDNHNPRGIWYFYVTDQERLRLSHLLQKQLELPLEDLNGQPYHGPNPAGGGQPGTGQPSTSGGEAPANGTSGGVPSTGTSSSSGTGTP
ncbi:LytR family transcriptional regulator [Marinithermofilum abyssi]|uniref:LytR family transcriptional regulator n=1 Tax=Marinithermofilum abyssi TaxID=1571185 RepID=A0A8J2VI05_9BACL|nr:LCP family protein [Marinithermofilum abyssi]GGE19719.1 LytR family transcriptional regulator [Marinithermofilum abyssi]